MVPVITWTNVNFSLSEVQWHSPDINLTVTAEAIILYNEFGKYTYKYFHICHGPIG